MPANILYHPNYHRLWTPVATLNILGAGGLKWSTMNEFWGVPKSAKSTAAYQVAQRALKDYGENIVVDILDAENSGDFTRLERIFDLRPHNVNTKGVTLIQNPDPRVAICPAATLEDGLKHLLTGIKKARQAGKFYLAIWDSISSSLPSGDMEEILKFLDDAGRGDKKKSELTDKDVGQYRSGMMHKAKTTKDLVTKVQTAIFHEPVCVILINQATTEVTRFFTRVTSAGGFGIKHQIHGSYQFMFQKPVDEERKNLVHTMTTSTVKVFKSKHIPETEFIPLTILNNRGGVISMPHELRDVAQMTGLVEKSGRGFTCSAALRKALPENAAIRGKKFHLDRILTSRELQSGIRKALRRFYCKNFVLVKANYEMRKMAKEELGLDKKPAVKTKAPSAVENKEKTKKVKKPSRKK